MEDGIWLRIGGFLDFWWGDGPVLERAGSETGVPQARQAAPD